MITFGGQPVFSTGGYVSNGTSVGLQFGSAQAGTFPLLQVTINPNGPLPGTQWTYTLTPTTRPTLQSLRIDGAGTLAEGSKGTYTATAQYSNGSERVIMAGWYADGALRLVSSSDFAVVQAQSGTGLGGGDIYAGYVEDGITVSGVLSVSVTTATVPNNPDAEQTLDPRMHDASKVGGPVHTGTGAESFHRPLLTLSGAREFEFGLDYSSTFSAVPSPSGKGWSHPFAAHISDQSSSVVIQWSSTRANHYMLVLSPVAAFYTSPEDDARDDVLEKTADGGFTLTKLDQTTYTFNSSGDLVLITNAHGQTVNIVASGGILSSVTEPISGASLTFTHTGGLMTSVGDNAGRTVQMTYTSDGLLSSLTDLNGRTTAYAYTATGKLSSVTAPDGQVIYQNTYDARGRVVAQDDGVAGNGLMRFTYIELYPGYLITAVTDRTGAVWYYTHDAQYRLLGTLNPLGALTVFTYDSAGRQTSVKDPLGRVSTTSYDYHGNPVHLVRPNGAETFLQYDARNNLTSVTNAQGQTASTAFDPANNPIRSTNFNGETTLRTFTPQSLIATETSPRGLTTSYTYTAGRLASVTNPKGEVGRFAYDLAGRLLTTTDAANNATNFTYSGSGKILTETNANGAVTTYGYDLRDRLASVRDPLGNTTTRGYDGNNNLLSITNAMGGITRMAYDGEDRLAKITNALGQVTTNSYDAAGHLTATANGLGQATTYKYDLAGNRVLTTDATGASLGVAYSAIDLPYGTMDALGHVTTFEYDLLGRLTRTIDPLGRASTVAYDGMSRVTSTADPLNRMITYSYDQDGHQIGLVNASGAQSVFSFDNAGRTTRETTPLNRATILTHDVRGLVTGETEPSGQVTTRSYDALGRMTSQVDSTGTIGYAYDAKNRLTTVTGGGKTIARAYDALDRLTRFTGADGNVVQYAYDAIGNLLTLTYPDGKTVNYTYDAANRLIGVRDWANRNTSYSYDAVGRLLQTRRPNGTVQQRYYDRLGELVYLNETTSAGSVIAGFGMSFDRGGQITGDSRTPARAPVNPQLASLSFDADDELTSFNGSPVTEDADGNMVNGPVGAPGGQFGAYTYDSRNRLTSAGGVNYAYDAENRRTSSQAGASITKYVNNPNATLWQVLTANNSAGTTYCVYGIGLLYTETNGLPIYHHFDPRGSTVATTDATGAVIFEASYDAYGVMNVLSGTANTVFLYMGQWGVMAESNGLNFCRARYYYPVIRRFINADPLKLGGGINRFAYAGGNPLTNVDPQGTIIVQLIGAGIGGILGVVSTYVTSEITGHHASGADYASAFLGGAVTGLVATIPGLNAAIGSVGVGALAGGAGGFFGGLTKEVANNGGNFSNYSAANIGLSTVFGTLAGAAAGKLGSVLSETVEIEGLNSGSNSFESLYKTVQTNLGSGRWTDGSLSASTLAKISAFIGYDLAPGAPVDVVKELLNEALFGKEPRENAFK